MATFIPGMELNRRFYEEAVRPLLAQHFPTLSYAAALIGPGQRPAFMIDHFASSRAKHLPGHCLSRSLIPQCDD
jgi:hypothetical protein